MSKRTMLSIVLAVCALVFPIQAALAAQTGQETTNQQGASPEGQTMGAEQEQTMEQGQMAGAKGEPSETVDKATMVFKEMMDAPQADNISSEVLQNAKAVVVVPNLVKAGFIAGGRHGTGVMLSQQGQGWSPPIFVSISGASVGAQLGVQSSDVILVFNEQRNVEEILEGNDLTLGVDASVSAGPAGAGAEATTQDAEVYSYKRSEGLFAGASLTGGVVTLDQSATMAYYNMDAEQARGYFGDENQMMQSILQSEKGPEEFSQNIPPSANQLQEAVKQAVDQQQQQQ